MAQAAAATNRIDLRHVLLVEDDAVLAMTIEQELRAAGCKKVSICAATDEALATLREERPDALVLDVHLADRSDGWALAELVNEIGPNPPKIIFSTGAPGDIPEEVAQLGTVLVKPYDAAELVAALATPKKKGLLARLRKS